MAHPDSLVPGTIVFLVSYYDEELLVPSIETLEFESRATSEDGRAMWLFREPNSEEMGIGFDEAQLNQLLDLEGLLRVIRELQLVGGGSNTQLEGERIPAGELLMKYPMRERIAAFLSSDVVSLNLTVRYTDDGMFIQKQNGGVELHCYMHPLRYPEQNSRMNALVASRGWVPREDYLADQGRTRILAVPCSRDAAELAESCAEIFASVYEMNCGDELRISNDE